MDKNLYETGVRPSIDNFLLEEAKKVRDYGEYWSASSAGYCMRKVIFDRLGVAPVKEDARKQKVFTVGHIFHEWIQDITKNAGISIAQELELIDDKLKIKGHIDDLIQIRLSESGEPVVPGEEVRGTQTILYDYKTQHSYAFKYQGEMSPYHRMQLGTYMMMLRNTSYPKLAEARILKISKDDLRMTEEQLFWSEELEADVVSYWTTINDYISRKKMPECTCEGFMATDKYNPYFYNGQPCSKQWYDLWKENKNS